MLDAFNLVLNNGFITVSRYSLHLITHQFRYPINHRLRCGGLGVQSCRWKWPHIFPCYCLYNSSSLRCYNWKSMMLSRWPFNVYLYWISNNNSKHWQLTETAELSPLSVLFKFSTLDVFLSSSTLVSRARPFHSLQSVGGQQEQGKQCTRPFHAIHPNDCRLWNGLARETS